MISMPRVALVLSTLTLMLLGCAKQDPVAGRWAVGDPLDDKIVEFATDGKMSARGIIGLESGTWSHRGDSLALSSADKSVRETIFLEEPVGEEMTVRSKDGESLVFHRIRTAEDAARLKLLFGQYELVSYLDHNGRKKTALPGDFTLELELQPSMHYVLTEFEDGQTNAGSVRRFSVKDSVLTMHDFAGPMSIDFVCTYSGDILRMDGPGVDHDFVFGKKGRLKKEAWGPGEHWVKVRIAQRLGTYWVKGDVHPTEGVDYEFGEYQIAENKSHGRIWLITKTDIFNSLELMHSSIPAPRFFAGKYPIEFWRDDYGEWVMGEM